MRPLLLRADAILAMAALVAGVVAAAAAAAIAAAASAPILRTVTVHDRQPAITFAAPGAEGAIVVIAINPGHASDGSLLTQNIVYKDTLTSGELQSRHWTYESRIDPGTWYVQLNSYDTCSDSQAPDCANGTSAIKKLVVPRPTTKYVLQADNHKFSTAVGVMINATELGDSQHYRLCIRTKLGTDRCVKGVITGTDWNLLFPVKKFVQFKRAGLGPRPKVTLFVQGKLVATTIATEY
jgi:hypothetical protein